jgi:hypothetical protein
MNRAVSHFKQGGILGETAKIDSPEVRYLLGTLSENERIRMEESFFADDARFDELELAEDQLIDAYVRNELPGEERQQFESQLRASPRLVERVHFASALAERAANFLPKEDEHSVDPVFLVRPAPNAAPGWTERFLGHHAGFRLAFATCLLLVMISSTALVAMWSHLRSETDRIAGERASFQREKKETERQLNEQKTKASQLEDALQREREKRNQDLKLIEGHQSRQKPKDYGRFASTLATILLTSGAMRGGPGGQPELIIGPGKTTAVLHLELEKNDYPTYNVVIKSVDGIFVTRKKHLKPHNRQLRVSLPTRILPANDYMIHVEGVTATGQVESVNDYDLHVKNTR